MKTKDKKEVIDALASHPTSPKQRYQKLVAIILALHTATPMQKRFYNATTYSPVNLSNLEYDLKKLCDIKDSEIKTVKKGLQQTEPPQEPKVLPQDVVAILEELNIEEADYHKHLKPLAKVLTEATGKEPESIKKKDLKTFITQFIPKKPTAEELADMNVFVFKDAPEDVKQGIKLREEYPFLAEEDCPDEFKILVADKFTALDKFVENRQELKALVATGATNEDLFEIAKKTVGDYELNLDIKEELNYYKDHKEVLGKHPIFAERMLKEKVNGLSPVDLSKRQKNLRSYVSRDEKAFNKMEEGDAKLAFGQKIEDWKKELHLVDARLEKIEAAQKID